MNRNECASTLEKQWRVLFLIQNCNKKKKEKKRKKVCRRENCTICVSFYTSCMVTTRQHSKTGIVALQMLVLSLRMY